MASKRRIPISKPFFDGEEIREVTRVVEGGNLTSSSFEGGSNVREVESLVSKFVGTKYAIALNSGTAALHASLLALGIGKGDEVLLPSFTFLATANAVVATGATPVFVDINRKDFTIDIEEIKSKITENSRAIIPVHLYGHVAPIRNIMNVAKKHSLHVIEDACQSLGSSLNGKQTGSFGDMGCFSFYASKVITSGEGGAVTTNSKELADKIRMIRNHGMVEGYDTRILGLNLRMTEICAAIAKVQMRKIRKILQMRKKNARTLSRMLNKLPITIPKEQNECSYNWYLYTVSIDRRDSLLKRLNSNGIGATVYYKIPVHKTLFYARYNITSLPNTEWAADHVLSLPVHPLVRPKDLQHVVECIGKELGFN